MKSPQTKPQDTILRKCADPDCGVRPISEFSKTKNGEYHQYCACCKNRRRMREWRAKNPERSREINRRSQSKPEYKAKRSEYQKERYMTPAFVARRQLWRAVQKGLVSKPEHCERCECSDIHAHHPDYNQPLLVNWLCKEHHTQADKQRRLLERLIDQLADLLSEAA